MHPKEFGPFKGPENLLERYVLRISGENKTAFSSGQRFDEPMLLHTCHKPPDDDRIGVDALRNEAGTHRRSRVCARKYGEDMDPNDEPAAA